MGAALRKLVEVGAAVSPSWGYYAGLTPADLSYVNAVRAELDLPNPEELRAKLDEERCLFYDENEKWLLTRARQAGIARWRLNNIAPSRVLHRN